MPTYRVDIPGKGTFRIDSPTELTDQQVYQAVMMQQPEAAAPAPKEEPGIMSQVAGIPKEFVKGVGSGLVQAVGGLGALPYAAARYAMPEIKPFEETSFGKTITQAEKALAPSDEGYITQLAGGLGSFASMFGPQAVLRGVGTTGRLAAGLAPKAATPFALAQTGGLGVEEARQRAAIARAEGTEVTPGEELAALATGVPIGLTELLPVEKLFRGLDTGLTEGFKFNVANLIKRALQQFGVEGAQEVASGLMQDLTAKGIYNPNLQVGQSMFDEMTVGGGVGAIAQTGLDILFKRRIQDAYSRTQRKKVEDEVLKRAEEARAAKEKQIATTKEQLGIKEGEVLALPAPAKEVEAKEEIDPLQNPLGMFKQDQLQEGYVKAINKMRDDQGMAKVSSLSIEDIADAGAPQEEIDRLIAGRLSEQGVDVAKGLDLGLTMKDVQNAAVERNIDTATPGFTDFLRRTTGSEGKMSPVQTLAAFEALSKLPKAEELQVLPEGTNATRFTQEQYDKTVRSIKDLFPEANRLGRTQVIQEIKDYSGLENDRDAQSLLQAAIRNGDFTTVSTRNFLTLDKDGKQVGIAYPTRKSAERAAKARGLSVKESTSIDIAIPEEGQALPGGPDIRRGEFKEGEVPEAFEIKSDQAVLATAKTEEEAAAKAERLQALRENKANGILGQIKSIDTNIAKSQQKLESMEADGKADTLEYRQLAAKITANNANLERQKERLNAQAEQYQAPLTVTPKGVKPVSRTGYTLFEQGKPTATFPTQQAAEEAAITRLDDETLQKVASLGRFQKGLMPKRLAAMAKEEMDRRAGKAPAGIAVKPAEGRTVKETEEKLADLGIFTPEFKKKVDELEKKLRPVMDRLGLKDLRLNIVRAIQTPMGEADGSYAEKLVTIALNADNPIRTLRHEAIHALKELGAFTDAQWKVLEKMAKENWLGKYGIQQRYKGLTQAEQIEEAIADAFSDFDQTKPPPGLVGALFNKIKKFFEAMGNAMRGMGFQTAEDVFANVEKGVTLPGGEKPSKGVKYSKAYHAGDLGYASDTTLGRMAGGRSTGHLGTGVYFTGKPANIFGREERPLEEVDLSDYKLAYPINEAFATPLYRSLKEINRLANSNINLDSKDVQREIENTAERISSSLIQDKLDVDDIKKAIVESVNEARNLLPQYMFESDYIDSASTRVMKKLGYEGIDNRHIPEYDNTEYGTVVYVENFSPKKDEERKVATEKEEKQAEKYAMRVKEPVSPLEKYVSPQEAQDRLRRRAARSKDTGQPSNDRLVFGTGKDKLVIGKITIKDWKDRVDNTMSLDEVEDARAWYQQLSDFFDPIFGEQASDYALAWLLSQKRAGPTKGFSDVLRASDLAADKIRIKKAGLNEKALVAALRKEVPEEGIGSKLLDFIDSELGKTTRTVMGGAKEGRQPAAIDVWAQRDIGFVDETVQKFVAKKYGQKAANLLDLDTARFGEPQYEYGVDFYNDVADYLNRQRYMGGGWTAREVQAVGWVNMQKFMGVQPEFVRDIINGNTRRVSIGLAPGTGTAMTARLMGKEIPTKEAQRVISDLADIANVKITQSIDGVGAYLTYIEGSIQVDAVGSPESVDDFMDMVGYAFQQTEVINTRPLASGKNSAIDILSPSLNTQDKAVEFFTKFLEAMPTKEIIEEEKIYEQKDGRTVERIVETKKYVPIAPGFQQVKVDGVPGIRLVNFDGKWSKRQLEALAKAAEVAEQATGIKDAEFVDMNVVLTSTKNDWTKYPNGEKYVNSLRNRGRLRETELLQREYLPTRFDIAGDGTINWKPRLAYRPSEPVGRPSTGSGIVLGEKQPGAVSTVGVHYGKEPNLSSLSGSKYGTGIKGAEARRLSESPDPRIKKRVYFYLTEEGAPLPPAEAGLGVDVYTQKFDNILTPGDEMQAILEKANRDMNDFESGIVDAGYDGYAVPSMGMMVILNNDTPVNYQGKKDEVDPKKIKYALKTSLKDTIDPDTATAIERTTTSRQEEGFVERVLGAISPEARARFRAGIVNKYEGIERLTIKKAEAFGDQELLADQSAIAAALFSDRAAGVAASSFRNGVPVYEKGYTNVSDLNGTVKGLIPILEPLMKYNDPYIFQMFQYYAATKRGKRLDAEGREKLFTPDDVKRGQALESQYPEFKQVFDEYQKYNQGLVKFMKDTGVISDKEAQIWTQNWDYIPFYRQMEGEETVGPKVFSAISGVAKPKKLKGGEAPLADFTETVVRNARAAIEAGMKNVAASRTVRDVVAMGLGREVSAKEAVGTDIMTVKENGLTKYYQVDDPLLVESVKGLNLPQLPFLDILSKPAEVLRNLVTKDPGFMLANLMRDSVQAWVTTGQKMTPVFDTFKQYGAALANMSPESRALAQAGLFTGYDFSGDVKATAREVEKELRKRSGTRTVTETALWPVTKVWEALEKGSTASDVATRAEVYKRVLKETGNEAEAMYQAMEVLNFSRRGSSSLIRVLTAMVPFMNARIQGLDVLYRAGFGKMATQNREIQKKAFAVRSLYILGLSSLYWALASDTEEYKTAEPEVRDNYWIVGNVRIPIPFEIGTVFKVFPERILEYWFGQDTGKDLKESIFRNVTSTLAFNPIPQAVLPMIENVANYSFFTGQPVVGKGMENVAPKYQATTGTSILAKEVGEATGYSPIKIDNLIRGYTGTLGTYAVMLIDAVSRGEGDPTKATMKAEQLPVIKRFFASEKGTGTITAYYDLKKQVDEATRTINFLERTGNIEDLRSYYQDKGAKLIAVKPLIQAMDKDMTSLRELRQSVLISKMEPDRKREVLDQIRNAEVNLTSRIQFIKKQVS